MRARRFEMRELRVFGSFGSCLVAGSGAVWWRLGLWWARLCGSGVGFGFLRLIVAGSGAGFGLWVPILSGSGQSWLVARQAAVPTHQQRPNKALHPTAYSFGFRSCLATAFASGGG